MRKGGRAGQGGMVEQRVGGQVSASTRGGRTQGGRGKKEKGKGRVSGILYAVGSQQP